jgi:hypothetical protein
VKGPPNQNLPEGRIKGGTIVFAVFAVISLIVSLVNGLVPIYLIEAASWGGLAWYWQRRNRHSETAKSIVVILAAIVIIGEVIHITVRHEAANAVDCTPPIERSAQFCFPTDTGLSFWHSIWCTNRGDSLGSSHSHERATMVRATRQALGRARWVVLPFHRNE